MSLKSAIELLQIAHNSIEIKNGPFGKGKHALTLENGTLVLTINTGYEFKNFLLDEADLVKDPQELILEIVGFLERETADLLKEMN